VQHPVARQVRRLEQRPQSAELTVRNGQQCHISDSVPVAIGARRKRFGCAETLFCAGGSNILKGHFWGFSVFHWLVGVLRIPMAWMLVSEGPLFRKSCTRPGNFAVGEER